MRVSMLSQTNRRARPIRAFTLLEVVLAILIASGILVVALHFYQQAANFRGQLLLETERLTGIRLLMDRLTSELRTTPQSSGLRISLTGQSNFIRFIRTDLPPRAAWTGTLFGRVASPETDLRLVTYRLDSSDGTNITGLFRMEEPAVSRPVLISTGDVAGVEVPRDTAFTNSVAMLVSDQIRHLSFRFWNGEQWEDSWNAAAIPAGVEITLASEPLSLVTETNAPAEVFRRIIYLPGSATELAARTDTNRAEVGAELLEEAP